MRTPAFLVLHFRPSIVEQICLRVAPDEFRRGVFDDARDVGLERSGLHGWNLGHELAEFRLVFEEVIEMVRLLNGLAVGELECRGVGIL